jgi:AraC-like DNA-binding protein
MLNLVENPSSDHVREMAVHFNAELDESNDASTITMDNDKAKGFISSYRIFDGLSVWIYNVTFFSDFKVVLGLSEDKPYYFCYIVKGHFLHRFGDQDEFVKILQNQNMILRGSPETSGQTIFPANVPLEIAFIIVDTKSLGRQDIRNAKRIYSKVCKIFQKIPQHRSYRHLGRIDSETEKYASIVCQNNDVDLVGGLLVEGAVLNMLASQIKAYSDDISSAGPQSTLSESELSQITSLGAYIIDNIETRITIPKLSRHFGISPKKLQLGVKYLYGDSVGHYISNLRMGHAKHLLCTTDMNVAEVCYRVGISSGSYFSKRFKSRYSMLPSQYTS